MHYQAGRKPFRSNSVLHLYQNAVNGYLLFYTRLDCLVFFTLVNVLAVKYRIHLLGLCLMPDHLHSLLEAGSRRALDAFVREYTSRFSRCQNQWLGRKGPLFNENFGLALKVGFKAIRTAIAYLFNNPVEKCLVERAEAYRWNFLACAGGQHPFSESLVLRRASRNLCRAVREVNAEKYNGRPLSYPLLDRLFRNLSLQEKEQLTDYIISLYSIIDHEAMLSFYGSYETALIAFHANTGSEYDIKEDRDVRSDVPYRAINRQLLRETGFSSVDEMLRLPEPCRQEIFVSFLRKNVAPLRLLEKYFRLPSHRTMELSKP